MRRTGVVIFVIYHFPVNVRRITLTRIHLLTRSAHSVRKTWYITLHNIILTHRKSIYLFFVFNVFRRGLEKFDFDFDFFFFFNSCSIHLPPDCKSSHWLYLGSPRGIVINPEQTKRFLESVYRIYLFSRQ